MQCTLFLRRFTHLLRYDKPLNSLPFLLMLIIGFLSILNIVMVIFTEKENMEKRVMGFKDFVIVMSLFMASIERGLKPQKCARLIELIEDDFFVNRHEFEGREEKWHEIQSYFNEKRSDMEKKSKTVSKIFIFMFLGVINRHLFNRLIGEATGLGEKSEDWPTPMVYWSPNGFNNFSYFVYIYCLQSLIFLITHMEGYCIEISACLATERVLADFESIYILIEILAKDFAEVSRTEPNYFSHSYGSCQKRTDDLKRDMARLVRCHQRLNRNFKDCEKNSALVILIIAFTMCMDTCADIYIMLKTDNILTRVNYAATTFMVNLVVFYIYHLGQRIHNQNDILRQSLSNLPWIDKPHWFKKTLHIMLLRANVDTAWKPYGLHDLNHLSFKNLMKAAFTLGNFLYNTNIKGQQ